MAEQRHTVLVVDDNMDLLELLHEGLSTGFTVRLAHDGAEALESVFQAPPDCVIIDIRMPELNGFQFIHAMRGDPATMAIPLIILSAMPEDQGLLAGLLSGADRYLTKPVVPSELVPVIYEAIALKQDERDARMRALLEREEG